MKIRLKRVYMYIYTYVLPHRYNPVKQCYIMTSKYKLLILAPLFSFLLLSLPPAAADTPSKHTDIRIVMSAAFVSESGVGIYSDIASYLGKKLKRKVTFVSGFSYATINTMLKKGMADVGFICGLPYVLEHDKSKPSVRLLLAPVMKHPRYRNQPIYYSYVIVHKNSKIRNFSSLKGSIFIYNDEISNSGYNMPRAYMIKKGWTSGFFGKVIRSGSHEESIRMIATGKADASAVDSLVYDYDKVYNPQYVSQTRILKVLGPAGIPPIVISTRTPADLRRKIRRILLNMNRDPDGRKILDKALVDRFAIVSDRNYNSIRKMKKLAKESGYEVIR